MEAPLSFLDLRIYSNAAVSAKLARRGARRLASEMCIVHNIIMRGGNAVYLQCVNVAARGSAQDKLDFAHFAHAWVDMVHEHHRGEEEDVFPEINELAGQPGLMDVNVAEHAAFHEGLERLGEYVGRLSKGEAELDGVKVRAMMDDFMGPLELHLDAEIDTVLALEAYSDKCDWAAWGKKTMNRIIGELMKKPGFKVSRVRSKIGP